ncbi:hypothetical protein M758_10G117300 [Ceratodon purpureus]|nr:hypothetical protein M758_10G117300 [Ceratodon purpureus]
MPEIPASTLKMSGVVPLMLFSDLWEPSFHFSFIQETRRLTGDGDSGYEVKSLQDVKSHHDMVKCGHRFKYAPQFWCAVLSVQPEKLAQEEKKWEEFLEASRLKLEKRREASEAAEARVKAAEAKAAKAKASEAIEAIEASEASEASFDKLRLLRLSLSAKNTELFWARLASWAASWEYDYLREDLARLMSENEALRAHRAELNRIILNYLKLRHPQFHDGVRSSRQYYEEKDCNGGTKPIVQENWPPTADGDHGHHAMDDKWKVKPIHGTIMTGESPFGTNKLRYTRMSSGRTRTWSTSLKDFTGALLKTCLLAPKRYAGPDWSFVSEHLFEEYGIDRAAKSCEILWGSLLRRYNAIRDHELKIYNSTKNGPSYFEMDEEERLRKMLPPVFDLEWCKMMETILKAKPGEVQSGTTADECTSLSNDEDVLCGEDEAEDESCESAVSEVEDSTADSYVPQTEPTYTDKETIQFDASATLRNVVEDMVRPLITALRTRVEEDQKHGLEVLAAEMDKVALMLQDIRRVLVHSNETRGKDLPESPSQQIVPTVASGGKRKVNMDNDREAKKQAV